MADTSMKVNVAKLREIAAEITKIKNSYTNSLSQATKETEKLKGVWTGDASVAFVSTFTPLHQKCNEYMTTLDKTIKVLYDVADTYQATETSIESTAEKLPSLPTNTMM